MNYYTLRKFTSLSGFISCIAAIAGVVALIIGYYPLLYICAVITLIDSFIQVIFADQNSFATEIAMIVIGWIISNWVADFWICVSAALCIETALLSLFGWIVIFRNR